MSGIGCIALAVLIILLVPVVVLPWEGRRVPGSLHAAIAAGGLAAAGLEGGAGALPWAAAAGVASLLTVAAIVTTVRGLLNVQILTATDIKLLAAGSTWLGIGGAVMMICAAFAALFGAALLQRWRSADRRPDFAVIATLAIVCVSIQQVLPQDGVTATHVAGRASDKPHAE
jgi:hypothetical protein